MIPAMSAVGGGTFQEYVAMVGSYSVPGPDVAVRGAAIPFDTTNGYGTAYSGITISATATAGGCFFGPNAESVVYTANTNSTNTRAYAFSATGIGTQYAQPGSAMTGGYTGDVRHFPTPGIVGYGGSTTPFVNAYLWTNAGGYSTKYGNPSTLPANTVGQVTFRNQSTQAFACSFSGTTPFVRAWIWSSGFSTVYANPATVPTGATTIRFSPDGNTVLVGTNASPYVHAYAWSAGWSTKYSNPATLPTGTVNDVNWNPDSTAVMAAHSTSPYLTAYPFSAGFGTKYSNPATLLGGTGTSTMWNRDGTAVIANSSGDLSAYRWSAGFGTKYTSYTAVSYNSYSAVTY